MTPNELRIGNICKDDEGLFAKIAAIENKTKYDEVLCVFELWKESEWMGYWENDFEKMQPIPLTFQILLNAGFEYKGHYGINDNEVEQRFMLHNVIDGTSSFLVVKYITFYGNQAAEEWIARIDNDDIWTKELKYLHQLQNLFFAINQQELNIKL